MRSLLPSAVAVGILAATVSLTASVAPASAGRPGDAAHLTSVKVHRGGPDRTIGFHRSRAGEAFLQATVSAPGVSWAERGNESAVVSAYVDGHYATDIVITSSAPVAREFAVGNLKVGRHTLRLHYAALRSPSNAGVARLQDLDVRTISSTSPEYAAARFAPVLYGRNVAALGGGFQNNRTDTPLVAWHEVLPVAGKPRHHVLEYSVVWSNEDGGTNSPGLMAKWGRTTDIEWIYRVEINAQGHRVPGTGVFQSPAHATTTFHGVYDGTHPLLQTCTSNNNVCDARLLKQQSQAADPMRFALSTREGLPAGQPREHLMDHHPWIYPVMAREMLRENKIEASPDPLTTAVGDQRTYLYIALDHATNPATDAATVGLAVDVQVVGHADPFHSDHSQSPLLFTVNRDGPAATTVELPAGTTPAQITSISVRRVPIGITDTGASLHVTHLTRAFFLGSSYLPQPSFAHLPLDVTLTPASPTAVIWPAS